MNRILLALVLGLAALGAARPALAHATSTSYLLIELPRGEQPVALRWDMATHDIMWSVFIDQDYDGVITWQEVVDARARYIEPAVLREIAVARGGAACTVTFKDLALAERAGQNHLSIALSAACPKSGLLTVSGSLFMTGDASQRVLISSTRGKEQFAGVISPESSGWTEPARVSAWDSFVRFVGEGVWHVLIGYDHIAFVLLLLLPSVLRPVNGQWQGAQRLSQVARDIFTIITAFTVAHSTTLALAVTGTVHLPTQPIEVAIAASIAMAGGTQPAAAAVAPATAAGLRLRVRTRLRLRQCAQRDRCRGHGPAAAAGGIQHRRGDRAAGHRGHGAAGYLPGTRHALVCRRRDAAGFVRARRRWNRLVTAASLAAVRTLGRSSADSTFRHLISAPCGPTRSEFRSTRTCEFSRHGITCTSMLAGAKPFSSIADCMSSMVRFEPGNMRSPHL